MDLYLQNSNALMSYADYYLQNCAIITVDFMACGSKGVAKAMA